MVRLLGTVAHCRQCLDEFLGPLRARHGRIVVRRSYPINREAVGHPVGMMWLQCTQCAAEWVGWPDDGCSWCEAKEARMLHDERRWLLWPSWAFVHGGSRYDSLDDACKAIWRHTRGQRTDDDTWEAWTKELHAACRRGVISEAEAVAAIRRMTDAPEP